MNRLLWRRWRLDGWMNGGVLVAHASLDALNRPLIKLILRQMVLLERARPETWSLPARINTWLWRRKPGTLATQIHNALLQNTRAFPRDAFQVAVSFILHYQCKWSSEHEKVFGTLGERKLHGILLGLLLSTALYVGSTWIIMEAIWLTAPIITLQLHSEMCTCKESKSS